MDAESRGQLTAADVHDVAFSKPPFGRRGYNEDEVDDFLELLERRLGDPTGVRSPTAADVAAVSFSNPPMGKRGYDEDEVDAFLALAVQQLERIDGAPPATFGEAPPLDAPPKRPWYRFWS